MSEQPTPRRSIRGPVRTVAVGVAVVALVGIIGAGQALAGVVVPDERVLERQGMIDRHRALGQLDEQGMVAPPQRFIRPEPPTGPGPQLGDEQVAPSPIWKAPAGVRAGLVVILVVAALPLAAGAATTWRVRNRRPQSGSTA
jgi:hypothetical protein